VALKVSRISNGASAPFFSCLFFELIQTARLFVAMTGSSHCGRRDHAGVIQLVECQLPKLDVAGSSPVARSHVSANERLAKPPLTLASGGFFLATGGRACWIFQFYRVDKQLENFFRTIRIFLEQSSLSVRVLLLSASKVLLYCSAGESTHCLFSKAPAREILGPTADSRNNRPLITDLARDRNGSLLVCGWCAA
jgi:hypothetical protein